MDKKENANHGFKGRGQEVLGRGLKQEARSKEEAVRVFGGRGGQGVVVGLARRVDLNSLGQPASLEVQHLDGGRRALDRRKRGS